MLPKDNMPTIKEYYRKQGGTELLMQYWRNGVLGTATIQFLLLGKSRTALELLRQAVTLKTKERLEKKYRKVLQQFDAQWQKSLPHQNRRTVWVFWWQGEAAMPKLVKKCFDSVNENMKDWEIVLLTEQNYLEYTTFPDYILEKLKSGMITLPHFSDLLRLELLIRYGGLWLDATVLCISGEIPKSILKSDFFLFRPQKPGADGKAITMSSWLMWAKTNNRILMATQAMLYAYWQKNETLCDYFLLHHFMSIAMDYYEEESKKIPPFCNSVPHILLLHLFDRYDEQYWNDLKQMTCFHKLSYKLDDEKCSMADTYYDVIINKGLG